ncbi:hypothetical protein QQX98_003039 [Neonectria punicea]|uniref:Endonuclease/exonuclease/phosphatase domain-containing protein n=1 Tax=Neonectria punicea TaxID=979145 RepID=A0ABR1HGQ6_9HYPO
MASLRLDCRNPLTRPLRHLLLLVFICAVLLFVAVHHDSFYSFTPPSPDMTRVDVPPGASLSMDLNTSPSPSTDRPATMPLRIVSYNIRYATSRPVLGERPWDIRRPKLTTQLGFITAGHESSFLCLQECLYEQIQDVQTDLGESWANIGRGRGEGARDGEFSPIFYRRETWRCERHETRWLSKTPDRPSRGWDAVLNRIVTMGEFSHAKTGTRVVVMSTHFDHIGVKAREHSAELLIKFAKEWSSEGDGTPVSVVLLGGDFNSSPQDGAYKTMTAPGSGMADISDLVPERRHYGNHVTYTSFGEAREVPSRIDFLFIQEPRTAQVNTFGVLANNFDDKIRVSDHRPVVADLDIVI